MKLEEIEEVLERVGFEQILLDHSLTELDVLDLLQDLKYISLEDYLND